jgi:ferric-dicitrate binding protein FerR (iron transport regulator)
MKLTFPSREFDEAVAAACHGMASDEQARALNELVRSDAAARDEYILRLELHSRLASEPDLFPQVNEYKVPSPESIVSIQPPRRAQIRKVNWILALAAGVALLAAGWWTWRLSHPNEPKGTTSKAVAMLNRVVDTQWEQRSETPKLGSPLEPGSLRLKAGLAEIVFYSGARVVIEGPIELQIISPSEASCRSGRLVAEVPPQAKGFRVGTPQMSVTDLGTEFGVAVKELQTELHVFKGSVEFQPARGTTKQSLREGVGAVVDGAEAPRLITVNRAGFASLFDFQAKLVAAELARYDQWRAASRRLNQDPSLLVRFDFDHAAPSDWRLRNVSSRSEAMPDATIVGGHWIEGRWPAKPALEFQGVSDRVRLNVPGEFDSLTLATWVRVQGLDRQINSLFMSDGFDAGTVHWSIRDDGVLGFTVIGSGPGNYQLVTSPPVLTLDKFGMWLHLAVVLDGSGKRVTHYVNGQLVSEKALRQNPPFRIGSAEVGNWNARGFPGNDPFHIRNFSGAMDEFCIFSRALSAEEIRALYSVGKPQPDPVVQTRN